MTVPEADAAEASGLHRGDRKIAESYEVGERITAWLSFEPRDPAWDRFLELTPLGQFQQASFWAAAKAAQGWAPLRVVITADGVIVAGFQILVRSALGGRVCVGYVSKGPVVAPGRKWTAQFTIETLQTVIRQQGLAAVVVQPPDLCRQIPEALAARGFLPDFLMSVNDATWLIDLDNDAEPFDAAISRTTRRGVRRAIAAGIVIRHGGEADLEDFFALMRGTCRRQHVNPSPSRLAHLRALWDAASPSGNIRLYLAEAQGRTIAGLLVILFGATATLWKIGAAPPGSELKPNDWLICQAVQWAREHGCRRCDFAAFDRSMALSLLSGAPLSEQQKRSRYLFLTRFGGRPSLLPMAQIYFTNPVLRAAYRFRFQRRLRAAVDLQAASLGGHAAVAEHRAPNL